MASPVLHRGKWRIRWVDEHGKRQSAVFEDKKEAEFRLRQEQLRVEEVRRGLRAARPGDRLCHELFDYWLAKRAPRKRSYACDVSIIKRHLRPAFGHLKLREVNVQTIDDYVAAKSTLRKQTVRNQLTLLRTMLALAVDLGWLSSLPKVVKPKVRLLSQDYRWLRTQEEVDRFLRAAWDEGPLAFTLYATAVYTGMRLGELAVLEWGDVNFDRRLITVSKSLKGPTKAEDVRYVPILDPLLPLLRAWRLKCPGRLVFPNRSGRAHDSRASVFHETLHSVLDAADFPQTIGSNGKARRYITFHSLRHTFASMWILNGGDLYKLQHVLGHKTPELTQRYAHLKPEAYAGDYGRLGPVLPIGDAPVVGIRSA